MADIVRRARVSRAAFYTHFTDKEDCFLAATQEGGKLMVGPRLTDTRALPPGTPDEEMLRVGVRAFLAFGVAREPEFSKIFYVDMPAAGPRAWERLEGGAAPIRGAEPDLARAGPGPASGLARGAVRGVLGAGRCHGRTGPRAGPPR